MGATPSSVLVVGASVAGVGAVNELRRCGYAGAVTLIDGQAHLPYDRPPLSKAALWEPDLPSHFHDAAHYRALDVTLWLGIPARALHRDTKTVELANGETLSADAIVIATGARARPFPADRTHGRVHTIRDLDDAATLRADLTPGRSLAVVGGGFIGAEVASSAAKLGLKITIIEMTGLPFERILGPAVAARVARLHTDAATAVISGVGVVRIEDGGETRQLVLSDGRRLAADIVVVGLGSQPNVEWLEGSGVSLADGVACDPCGRTNVPGIYAAGDAAAWPCPRTGLLERNEHWTAAREQGRIVAQTIVGARENRWADFVPYFWSDMHGKRIQLLGSTKGATNAAFVFDDPEKGSFVVEYRRDGALIGVAGCNAAVKVMRYAPRLVAA